VGLIQELENRLLDQLKRLFAPVLKPLNKLWGILKGFFTAIVQVIPETTSLVKLIYNEIFAWRDFKKGINFKTGVINLQSARDRIEDLISEILDAWHALVSLFTDGFKIQVKSVKDAVDAVTEVAEAFDSIAGSGLREFFERIGPTLEKAGGKVFEILAIIQAVAEELLKVVREINKVVTAIKDVRETFQTGEGLFLSQTNPRKTVKLDDGSTVKFRVGNLHDA